MPKDSVTYDLVCNSGRGRHQFLLKDGTLESRMRFEDKKTFRAPWETVVSYRKLPKGTEVREDTCLDPIKTTQAIDEKK